MFKSTIIGEGIVFASDAAGGLPSKAFSSVCVLPSGRWLAACRTAPRKTEMRGQHVTLSFSDDEGMHWSAPVAPFLPPPFEGKPGLFHSAYLTALGRDEVLAALMWIDHSDPDADFFNKVTEGLLETRIFFARSSDGGVTWGLPCPIDTAPFTIPTPLTGPVLLGQNGEWICQFELNKHYDDLTEWRHSSVLMFSHDEGVSWPEFSIASNDPDNKIFYWDQRPRIAGDGGILDVFWTYDNAQTKYLNIHARRSPDGGKTWSSFWDTGVPGQPAPPVFLSDGRIAMVYVDREAKPILKLRLSDDGGKTWPQTFERDLFRIDGSTQTVGKNSMQDAWAEMGAYSLGLPTTALLPDGDILVVFYAGRQTDQTDVRWIRISI